MKKILFFILSLFVFVSCGKDEPWSPNDDLKDFLLKNPYGVVFENATCDDLFIKCDKLSANIIVVKSGAISDSYHSSEPGVIIEYSGEGTYWTKKTKYIFLEKDKITNVTLSYP